MLAPGDLHSDHDVQVQLANFGDGHLPTWHVVSRNLHLAVLSPDSISSLALLSLNSHFLRSQKYSCFLSIFDNTVLTFLQIVMLVCLSYTLPNPAIFLQIFI